MGGGGGGVAGTGGVYGEFGWGDGDGDGSGGGVCDGEFCVGGWGFGGREWGFAVCLSRGVVGWDGGAGAGGFFWGGGGLDERAGVWGEADDKRALCGRSSIRGNIRRESGEVLRESWV